MIIQRDPEDILHFLIKQKKTRWTLQELSCELLICKRGMQAMLTYLKTQGYIKTEKIDGTNYYSLTNS